ncbi:Luciferase-like monooxygenase [Streptomyces sp. DvalAA-14]|uniref:LLM class flavin-dependent oxidoreductase n=1 Tax=unclassified Streptomyces TaxID=2593676 RepID=UPI00081B2075|nr:MULTISPECIES: LLM class flavin-dependent oxidoreductase [unclassified Streptomyces]MYS24482.1 LLM class flavin-dependent oxidoreductase [Streptomyces sp. SID4948]SCE46497.1 Luciferase-like monooxygenase [Streptomyces sp. DvalAA-14]
MPDYGHDLLFGTLLEPPADRPQGAVELADLTEGSGLDLVSLSDHPYWPERLDTMTLLSTIAARTSRVRVMPNLANLPLRPPTVLARTAATLDILTGGRFELGLATGAQQMWDAILAEGGPARGPGESVDALEEAVQIIRRLWTPGDDVRFAGRHYRLDGVRPGPFPVHDINIWVGAYQPRMLRLVGRIADGWVPSSPFLPPERLGAANQIIDVAATEAGRLPEAVRRVYNVAGDFAATSSGFLQGPAPIWAEQLTELALTQGVSVFILYRADSPNTIRRFGEEVAPAVRRMVAAARSGSSA